MIRLLARRLALIIPTVIGVTLLGFLLVHAVPGDPVEVRTGERGISPERLAYFRHELGLDQPLWKQFARLRGPAAARRPGPLRGDAGERVDGVHHLLPGDAGAGACAMVFALAIGLPLGVIAAVRRGSPLDYGLIGLSVTGASMPIFWWGLMAILIFSVALGWTPVSGRIDELYYVEPHTGFLLLDILIYGADPGAFRSAVRHLILPTIVLGTIPLATIARMTRSAMLEVLGEDYVRTARAKGLSPGRVVVVHALRNALIPVVTVLGLQVGALLGGAILTETIFSWPGVGHWLVDSVQQRDYNVLQGGTLLIALLVMLVNLGVDGLYGLLNPRLRR